MAPTIEIYYDFRSPYAYFASHQIRKEFSKVDWEWKWRPVSIDVLLNLQAGRQPWAPYLDPLSEPKRAHLFADVRRLAKFYDLPLRPTKPKRPNSIPALCLAARLEPRQRALFNDLIFDALWQDQKDIEDRSVLEDCLLRAGTVPKILDFAFDEGARRDLANETTQAYSRGIFGVPTFVFENEVFFGSDRLDLLKWTVEKR